MFYFGVFYSTQNTIVHYDIAVNCLARDRWSAV